MSSYVYKKAIRYRIPDSHLNQFKDQYGYVDIWDGKNLLKNFGLSDKFTLDSGLNWDTNESEYYLDKIGKEIWDEITGDFTHSRLLTPEEIDHYLKEFQRFDPNIKGKDLRAVEYCYYNGVDAPACYEVTLEDKEDWMF